MVVHDPLYGRFVLPPHLRRLVSSPEVRRLSQIRLLNTLSPTLATLGEIRRYSHTLGVLFLTAVNGAKGFSKDEREALDASVLLHDIGTPPFGHLVEYHLRELKNWSHEKVIRAVLWGGHAPENRAHQIFASRAIEFRALLKRGGTSAELVQTIVSGLHPLSQLLFGTLDLDNLDNIVRMAWALGICNGASLAVELARGLRVDAQSRLILDPSLRGTVERWADLRERIYNILVFDAPTVASQAVLSDAVARALEEGDLSIDDWTLTDEQLLGRLLACKTTKRTISSEYLGRLPSPLCAVRVAGTLSDFSLASRTEALTLIETAIRAHAPSGRALAYVFIDSGAFQKRLEFHAPGGEPWQLGESSRSVVFYAFLRGAREVPRRTCQRTAVSILKALGVPDARVVRVQLSEDHEEPDDQFAFAL